MVGGFESLQLEEQESEDQPESAAGELQFFVDAVNHRQESPESTYGEDEVETHRPSIPFEATFDDYASSPLQSQESRNNFGMYSFNVDGVPLVQKSWHQWMDRGFRLPYETFFRTIRTAEPTQNLDARLTFPDVPRKKVQPHGLSDPDSQRFSAKQLLDKAGSTPGTRQSKRIIITGREEEEKARYLILDLERDGVNVPVKDVEISVDLDSLIWVTTSSGFLAKSMSVHLSPSLSSRAAIPNNNFISVTLMDPPKIEDELNNPRTRRHSSVALSRIPHIEFGYCGSGERRINFLIFFPRMIHKPQNGRRYATLLPACVQDLWFDKVIIPSCTAILKDYPGLSEYLPPSLHDMRKRLDYKQKSIFIADPKRVMDEIQRRIRDGGQLLSCFGSLFLVADGRGMKVATKQCVARHSENTVQPAFEQIKASFNELDWERMLDRGYGELYLDVGISYHTDYGQPLTGLWRIPYLQKSFEVLGSRSPIVYHLGTLGFYGGLKAEMKSKNKQHSHVVSRISYCLAFETVRSPGTQEYLCSNKDIIERSPKFLDAVRNWSELFLTAQSRSYGVRDEIRGLGPLILEFLPTSIEKVLFLFSHNLDKA